MGTYALLDVTQTPSVVTAIGQLDASGDIAGGLLDITNVTPQPQVGWTFDGTTWSGTAAANRATILQRSATALSDNQAYLAIGTPTNAQAVAQIAALTRQVDGLIRLASRLLDATT